MVGINQQDVPNSMRGYCMKKMKRFSCPAGFALLLIPLVSLVVMYLVICMEPDYLDYWNLQCQGFPALVLWNFLPIFFTISLLYFITKHLPFSLITGGAVWIAMGLVNHNKILLRSEPFMPEILPLVRELMGIIDTLDQSVLTGGIAILVALLLLMMLSLVLFRRTKMRWYVQLIGLIAVVMAAVFSYQTVYDNDKYYTAIPVDGYEYNRTDVSGSRGFIFMFTYEIHNAFMQKPEEYQAEEYQKMDESEVTPADYDDAVKPHIIMVMSEAFSDISDNVHLSMEEDPLENFKKISEDSLMSGYAVTNIYGGGTVVSEYESPDRHQFCQFVHANHALLLWSEKILTVCRGYYLPSAMTPWPFIPVSPGSTIGRMFMKKWDLTPFSIAIMPFMMIANSPVDISRKQRPFIS